MPNNARAFDALPPANLDEIRAAHAAGKTLVEYRGLKSCGISIPADEPDEDRLEKAEGVQVDKVFKAFGGRVWNLSQARAAKQTPGLGDRFVVFARLASFWWEVKRQKGGRVSPAQQEFHDLCNEIHKHGTVGGSGHFIGGRAEAEALVIALGLAYRDEASGALEPVRRGVPPDELPDDGKHDFTLDDVVT